MRQKINKVTERGRNATSGGGTGARWEPRSAVKAEGERNREKGWRRKRMDGVSNNDRGGGGRRGGAQRPLHGNSFISKDLDREIPFHFLISRLHSPTFLFYILPARPAHPSVRPSVRPPTRPPPSPPHCTLLTFPFLLPPDVAARSL